MPTTVNITKDQIFAEEESIKESVYESFEKRIEESNAAVLMATRDLSDGRFETQYSSIYASELVKNVR